MSERTFSYCMQVIPAASDGAVVFGAPPGWSNQPIEMWPCEQLQVLQLGAKVLRSPAVMVIWRKEVPSPGAADDDGQSSKLDA